MRQKALLFDFDGVIADTEGEYSKFWEGIGLLTTLPQDCGIARYHFELGASGGDLNNLPFKYSEK